MILFTTFCVLVMHFPSLIQTFAIPSEENLNLTTLLDGSSGGKNTTSGSGDVCDPSTCGPNAFCKVYPNLNLPRCYCNAKFYGNPYSGCRPQCLNSSECPSDKSCINTECVNPCTVCSNNATCEIIDHVAYCLCKHNVSSDPLKKCVRLRPECVSSSECPSARACLNYECIDPCPGVCGFNAICRVLNHSLICSCLPGYIGNPFVKCTEGKENSTSGSGDICDPSLCGQNAVCTIVPSLSSKASIARCSCVQKFYGDPYVGCRPECTRSADCPSDKYCTKYECLDPCPGLCGEKAECKVNDHRPNCSCIEGFEGNPYLQCTNDGKTTTSGYGDVCDPSPCGSNTFCTAYPGPLAHCSCVEKFYGDPYSGCRPECVHSSECPSNRACINNECVDPCPQCSENARCETIDHVPYCICKDNVTIESQDKCVRFTPECVSNTNCASTKACINYQCIDPCPGVCGFNATCSVLKHSPICSCILGFTGDPFVECTELSGSDSSVVKATTEALTIVTDANPCHPSPCGLNVSPTTALLHNPMTMSTNSTKDKNTTYRLHPNPVYAALPSATPKNTNKLVE